ncbi:hypothetical protein AAFP30_19395 [Gordonia sp. CPCC 205515]|uniref:hypothetical protein n=1 Tax=Gordonia sp. CPCC 205515 TaxID=3140791 RepID=UPI003AF399A5
MTPAVQRTTYDDDLFIRMDRAVGLPVVSQGIWRLRSPLTAEELTHLATQLDQTPASRRLHAARLPLARSYWTAPETPFGRVHLDAEIADDEIMSWIDAAADVTFDLTDGPVWELRAAPLASGGGIVSRCTSHAVGDGWMGRNAMLTALGAGTLPDYHPTRPSLLDDLRDATGQAITIGRNLVGLAGHAWSARAGQTEVTGAQPPVITSQTAPARTDPPPPDADAHLPFAVAAIPAAQWRATATAAGGSSNALFIAVVVGLTVAAGRASWDDRVRVSVPMSVRDEGDTRANSTTGVSVDVPAELSKSRDLGPIRELARAAYQGADTEPSLLVRLQPLMQALPDAAVAALSRNAATPLALASNNGVLDPVYAGLGDPDRADSFAGRAVTPGADPTRRSALRGALSVWLNECGDAVTLSVSGLDPYAFPSVDALRSIVQNECLRWGLTATQW